MFSAAATGNYTLDFSGDIDDMKISVGTRTLTLLQDLTINNTLTIDSVEFLVGVGRKFLVSGDVITNETNYSATATVSLVGSSDQTLTSGPVGFWSTSTFQSPAGTCCWPPTSFSEASLAAKGS